MKTSERKLSRRGFLKTTAASAGALAFVDRAFWSMTDGLVKLGVKPPWFKGEARTTYNYCDICPFRCGIVVKSVGGRVFKIDGNPNDPKSRGKLCARGQAGVSFLYDPDRIKQPMIRVGERGEGKFRNATWAEALDYAAKGLTQLRDKYGQESLAVFGHTSGDFWFTDYFAQAFGTVNAAKPSVSMCTSPREEASILTTGRAIGNYEPVDWDAAKCIVLMGTHIGKDARNTLMQDLANARANGARLIVIDPRFSSAAMKADYWLQIKPGTDTALLLAWMNVLISERLIDTAFIEKWTVGFDQLAAHVKYLTPEWAAAITELPAALIRASARALGAARPSSVIVPGRHVIWYGNDTQRMRAVYMVMGLLGSYGRPGGLYFNKSPFIDEISHPPFLAASAAGGCGSAPGVESAPQPGPTGKTRADGLHERFMRGGTAIQELIEPMITGKPYPIKGLIVYGVNLFHMLPNRPRTIEALKNLDFVMVVDTLPQDHVAWADVVLPESTYLERYDELWGCGHRRRISPCVSRPSSQSTIPSRPGGWSASLVSGLDWMTSLSGRRPSNTSTPA